MRWFSFRLFLQLAFNRVLCLISSISAPQEPSQRLVAGVLPHSAERPALWLSAEPPESPLQTVVGPAAELQQQTAHAQEPPGGAAAGEPQGISEMTIWDGSPVRLQFNCKMFCWEVTGGAFKLLIRFVQICKNVDIYI